MPQTVPSQVVHNLLRVCILHPVPRCNLFSTASPPRRATTTLAAVRCHVLPCHTNARVLGSTQPLRL